MTKGERCNKHYMAELGIRHR